MTRFRQAQKVPSQSHAPQPHDADGAVGADEEAQGEPPGELGGRGQDLREAPLHGGAAAGRPPGPPDPRALRRLHRRLRRQGARPDPWRPGPSQVYAEIDLGRYHFYMARCIYIHSFRAAILLGFCLQVDDQRSGGSWRLGC
ncbi:uncharacterized protein LOC125529408 isoform X1 [Triticum urartu]|uniref:uncharacterized protein LOC125529408 isoform X1 n=1 Tax=Triticum urartu TaxID=4572 RepID=UPI0020434EE0|nr:uncharacterized protein LOC125529408 isoform X1 [Triticum urartu]